MGPSYVFPLALGIGVVAGLRSMLAPAAMAWAVKLGWLNLHESPFAFMESNLAVAGFSIVAVGELVADLLPFVPRRTAIAPLVVRMISGSFCAACLCASVNHSVAIGVAFGAAGAVIGAFSGYEIRKRLVRKQNIKDFVVALSEDAIAVGLALFFVSR